MFKRDPEESFTEDDYQADYYNDAEPGVEEEDLDLAKRAGKWKMRMYKKERYIKIMV